MHDGVAVPGSECVSYSDEEHLEVLNLRIVYLRD